MIRICLLDDKGYALPQIVSSIPPNVRYILTYIPRIADLPKDTIWDILLLDYYLDLENLTGLDAIPYIRSRYVIGFSSEASKSQILAQAAGSEYAVEKLSDTDKNLPLAETIQEILEKLDKPSL